MHRPDETLGQIGERFTVLIGAIDDLVINIGNIADIGDLIAERFQITIDHIKHHHHSGVPQMTEVVNRHATDIHPDLSRLQRDKLLLLMGKIIVDLQHNNSGRSALLREPG